MTCKNINIIGTVVTQDCLGNNDRKSIVPAHSRQKVLVCSQLSLLTEKLWMQRASSVLEKTLDL